MGEDQCGAGDVAEFARAGVAGCRPPSRGLPLAGLFWLAFGWTLALAWGKLSVWGRL